MILSNAADGSGKIRIEIDHQIYKMVIMTRAMIILGSKNPWGVSWVNDRKEMGIMTAEKWVRERFFISLEVGEI